jgi:hypothetical protein
MKTLTRACCATVLGALLSASPLLCAVAAKTHATDDVVLTSMEKELKRAQQELGKQTPAAYYLSYAVHDDQTVAAVGMNGTLISSTAARRDHARGHSRTGQLAPGDASLGDPHRDPGDG